MVNRCNSLLGWCWSGTLLIYGGAVRHMGDARPMGRVQSTWIAVATIDQLRPGVRVSISNSCSMSSSSSPDSRSPARPRRQPCIRSTRSGRRVRGTCQAVPGLAPARRARRLRAVLRPQDLARLRLVVARGAEEANFDLDFDSGRRGSSRQRVAHASRVLGVRCSRGC